MTKYKPKNISILPRNPQNPFDWIGPVSFSFLKTMAEYYTQTKEFRCGNPDCKESIFVGRFTKIPEICQYCAQEIDWDGIYSTRLHKCPTCNIEYDISVKYCNQHGKNAISLVEFDKYDRIYP